jgi:hypothetical protein
MTTIHLVAESPLSPERVLAAGPHDHLAAELELFAEGLR